MKKNLIPANVEQIEHSILLIRGQRVILDSVLAQIYGVETKAFVRQVKRNMTRFPADFAFQLNKHELDLAREHCTDSTKTHGGRRYHPYAFTEHGVVMAANVLRSEKAVKASIYVVRAFVKLRQLLATHRDLAQKLDELELQVATHDKAIVSLFDAIRKLMSPLPANTKKIGFIQGE